MAFFPEDKEETAAIVAAAGNQGIINDPGASTLPPPPAPTSSALPTPAGTQSPGVDVNLAPDTAQLQGLLSDPEIAAILQPLLEAEPEEDEDDKPQSISQIVGALFATPPQAVPGLQQKLREPFSKSPRDVLELQQNLIDAGYISKKQARAMTPGWYDGVTAKAYAYLIQDASARGLTEVQALDYRLALQGNLDKDIIDGGFGSVTPEVHAKQLSRAYERAWGRNAPPGYVDKFMDFNPDEFEAFERAKESWQDSSRISQADVAHIETGLQSFIKDWNTPYVPEAAKKKDKK